MSLPLLPRTRKKALPDALQQGLGMVRSWSVHMRRTMTGPPEQVWWWCRWWCSDVNMNVS